MVAAGGAVGGLRRVDEGGGRRVTGSRRAVSRGTRRPVRIQLPLRVAGRRWSRRFSCGERACRVRCVWCCDGRDASAARVLQTGLSSARDGRGRVLRRTARDGVRGCGASHHSARLVAPRPRHGASAPPRKAMDGSTLRLLRSHGHRPHPRRHLPPPLQSAAWLVDPGLPAPHQAALEVRRGSTASLLANPARGAQESPSRTTLPEYDPECYLCPTNTRATGDVMPAYTSTYIFVNDYSAVKEDQQDYVQPVNASDTSSLLLQAEGVKGRCYVITFHPAHNRTLADLSPSETLPVVETWNALYRAHLPSSHPHFAAPPESLGMQLPRDQYTYLQIFENKGAAMGCSNPHPHGQAWCTSGVPEEPALEIENMKKYKKTHGRGLLSDYVKLELQKGERVFYSNDSWAAMCPWWATWPFEVLVVCRREVRSLPELTLAETAELADVVAQVTKRYDNLFETQFPYSR